MALDMSVATGADSRAVEARYNSGAYGKRDITIVRGSGATVWDDQGRSYVDCTSGYGTANIGHCHPAVQEAIARQAGILISCQEAFYNDRRAELLETLASAVPPGLNRFFLCNSGTEANEAALKFARLATGRTGVVAAQRGFHGRTMGALSTTWEPQYRQPFEPLVAGVRHVPYDRLDAIDPAIDDSIAAVILEVVQGEGGVRPAAPGYVAAVAKICRDRGALLILDEVQTGFGRTGRLFACEHDSVTPDLLCMAKSMAGGLPMGAVALGQRVTGIRPGAHGSTFGGNPLACAAALATLAALRQDRLIERAAATGALMLERLKLVQAQSPVVRDVRGLGMMLGIELRDKARPFMTELQARGVLALPAGPTTVRLLPPLVISDAQADHVLSAVAEALQTWQPHRAETKSG